jgi:SAM-dependent methyltransferase
MRQENLARLSSVKIKPKSPQYIHLYFLLNSIREHISLYAKGKLLDDGCGNKPYEEWYKQVTTEQTGCDVIQSDAHKVDVVCPATALSFPDNSFDTVLCTQVLEHVYDHHAVIREANRVLQPGGKLILTVPFCWELHEEPYDFFRVSKHGLKELFEENNFEVLTIKANGGKWAATFQMFVTTIYSTFKYKTVRAKLLKILFVELRLTVLLNKLGIWIDKRYFDDVWTLNYIIVGEKK